MSRFLVALFLFIIFAYTASAQTLVSGEIFGEWNKAGSPYVLVGNCIVPEGEQLWIKPGVTVRFKPPADSITLTIKGNLVAAGEAGDSVIFTSNALRPTSKDWGTVLVDTTGLVRMQYIHFPYYNQAIVTRSGSKVEINHSKFRRYVLNDEDSLISRFAIGGSTPDTTAIKNCLFDGLGLTQDAINLKTSNPAGQLQVDSCHITNHTGTGIYLQYSPLQVDTLKQQIVISNSTISKAINGISISAKNMSLYLITGNTISDCTYGIVTTATYCNPIISFNDIYNHSVGGISFTLDSELYDTCTIANNRIHHCLNGLVRKELHSEDTLLFVVVKLNTIAYCERPIYNSSVQGKGLFSNNIFAFCNNNVSIGNKYQWFEGYSMYYRVSGYYTTLDAKIIFADPLFVNENDLHLQPNSPAIDRGLTTLPVGDEPEPNGGRINLGGYGGTSEATQTPDPPSDGYLTCQHQYIEMVTCTVGDSVNSFSLFLTNAGYQLITILGYSFSDPTSFTMRSFLLKQLQPLERTSSSEFVVWFNPKVEKSFQDTLTIHTTDGDYSYPITARSVKGTKVPSRLPNTSRWTKNDSPYLVAGWVYGDSLIIDPGVTVLFIAQSSDLDVNTLVAEGIADEPINFNTLGEYTFELSLDNGRLRHCYVKNSSKIDCYVRKGNGLFARDVFIEGGSSKSGDGLELSLSSASGTFVDIERITIKGFSRGINWSNHDTLLSVNIRNINFINNATAIYFYDRGLRDTIPSNLFENSIFYGNDKCASTTIYGTKDSIDVRYSLFWNNGVDSSAGFLLKNPVSKDPLLFSSPTYPFALDFRSPCIDAGNPDSPLDPDGSRADIGGWTFDHNNRPALVARLEPQDAELECDVDQEVLFDVLGDDPEEWTLDYLWLVDDSTFWGSSTLKWTFAESGEYLVAVQAFDGFNFSGTVDWLVRVAPLDGKPVATLPAEFSIHSVYPNPFNDLATLRYTLPGAGVVELTVYDVQGRALLYNTDTRSVGGTVTRVLDFGDYPAGLYFLRMQYGDKIEYRKLVYIR